MKKLIIIAAAVLVALVAFLTAMTLLVNARGGLAPKYSGLKKAPLLGTFLKVKEPPPAAEETEEEVAAETSMPYLQFGTRARLARLAEQLEAKKAEYEALKQRLERKARELTAWEQQLKVERDNLRERFGEEKRELAGVKDQLDRREKALDGRELRIQRAEERNLATTAAIYDKMDAEKAANILMEMYSEGQEDIVVKLVYLMQQRSAAKTLEAFPDPKVGARITERLRHVAPPDGTGG